METHTYFNNEQYFRFCCSYDPAGYSYSWWRRRTCNSDSNTITDNSCSSCPGSIISNTREHPEKISQKDCSKFPFQIRKILWLLQCDTINQIHFHCYWYTFFTDTVCTVSMLRIWYGFSCNNVDCDQGWTAGGAQPSTSAKFVVNCSWETSEVLEWLGGCWWLRSCITITPCSASQTKRGHICPPPHPRRVSCPQNQPARWSTWRRTAPRCLQTMWTSLCQRTLFWRIISMKTLRTAPSLLPQPLQSVRGRDLWLWVSVYNISSTQNTRLSITRFDI